jgi:hypothetical protein
MAEKKAEISNINLESGSLNLDDEQIQITGYEGYNKKNSLFLGNQLKNCTRNPLTHHQIYLVQRLSRNGVNTLSGKTVKEPSTKMTYHLEHSIQLVSKQLM